MANLLRIITICLIFTSCTKPDNQTLIELLNRIPAKKFENYSFNSSSALISRISETPDFVISYLEEIDNVHNYKSYLPTREEMEIIDSYLVLLPTLHKNTIQEKLIGIYFVENFMGSGMTDYVVDDNKNIYTILIINPETLTASLSEWMTYRENTCFIKDDNEIEIYVDFGSENDYLGLLYILLHETSHIVDYIHNITPYIESEVIEIKNEETKEQTEITVNIWKDHHTAVEKYNEEYMKNITFYGFSNGPLLLISDADNIYSHLRKTPFPSLYGSKNWAEDFAEILTWYHITSKLDLPYELKIYRNNEIIQQFRPMDSIQVQERLHILQNFY